MKAKELQYRRPDPVVVVLASIIGALSLFFLWQCLPFSESNITKAQTSDSEYQKLLERDKNVSTEKVERAFAEAKRIQDEILAAMAKEMPDFKFQNARAVHSKYDNPGRRGETHNEVSWQRRTTRLNLNFQLRFDKENALALSRRSIEATSMGEFFDVPNLGDEATLVKNVVYNAQVTSVGLHFVKGRVSLSIYLQNFKRKTEKNEKELMKIVKLIEPLIIARPDFDDD